MRMMLGVGTVLALTASTLALARPQEVMFEAEGRTFAVEVRDRYCTDGKRIESYVARQRVNVPDWVPQLVMMPCGIADGAPKDMIAIFLRPQFGSNNDRKQVFAQTMAQATPDAIAQSFANAQARMSQLLQARVDIDAAIGILGSDEACVYIGGTRKITIDGQGSTKVAVGGCLTVVSGQVFYIYYYLETKDPAKVAGIIPVIGAVARSMRVSDR